MEERSGIAQQLKLIRKNNKLTQKALAERLGIGQTAIANYETGKRFPDEAILIRIADTFDISLDRLLGRASDIRPPGKTGAEGFSYTPSDLTERRDEFMDKALNSSTRAAGLVLSLFNRGYTEEQILIDLLGPALAEAGKRWAEGRYNEAMEHQLSMTALQSMLLLQAGPVIKKSRGKAVFLTAAGEGHNIGLKMLSRFLELDGWECYYLGSSVPARTLQEYIQTTAIDLVCISATLIENIDSLCAFANAVKTIEPPPFIMAGGHASSISEKRLYDAGVDYIHHNINDTVNTARKLKSKKIQY